MSAARDHACCLAASATLALGESAPCPGCGEMLERVAPADAPEPRPALGLAQWVLDADEEFPFPGASGVVAGRIAARRTPRSHSPSPRPAAPLPATGEGAPVQHLVDTRPEAPVSYRAVVEELWAYERDVGAIYRGTSGLEAHVVRGWDERTKRPTACLLVGTGNRGSKPLGRASVPEPPPAPSAATRDRLRALPPDLAQVAEAVRDDLLGWGAATIDLPLHASDGTVSQVPTPPWSVEARVGVRLAGIARRVRDVLVVRIWLDAGRCEALHAVDTTRWARAVLRHDTASTQAAARIAGTEALEALARGWG